jgi:putative phosphoribosyl transferase
MKAFVDRKQAGRELGQELAKHNLHSPVVLALPRGGVPVAAEVAAILNAPLDVLIVRKVGAPGNPELAAAAIVAGESVDVVLNQEIVEAYDLTPADLSSLVSSERKELDRRVAAYDIGRGPVSIANKTVIVVDDGMATGTTAKAALRSLRRRGPARIVLAVPVAPADVVHELEAVADLVVCLRKHEHFRALGYHYLNFEQLSDQEVISARKEADASYEAANSHKRRTSTPASP